MLRNSCHDTTDRRATRWSTALATILPLALTACLATGHVHVASMRSPDASFATQRNFHFLSVPASLAVQPDAPTLDDPMLESSISGREVRRQIAASLMARGYVHARDSADLAIAYYIGAHSALVVTDYDYGYPFWDFKSGPPPEQSWPHRPTSYRYEQGTVIIDVLDRNGHRLLWRGIGRTKLISNSAKYARRLATMVAAVMTQFPGRVPAPAIATR